MSIIEVNSWRELIEAAWPAQPAVLTDCDEYVATIIDYGALAELPHLLAHERRLCKVWTHTATDFHSVRTGAADAAGFLAAGSVVVWDDCAQVGLDALLASDPVLASQTKGYAANVLAAGAGANVAVHFDRHEVMVLQVRGRKRWWVCRNKVVHCPTVNYLDRSEQAAKILHRETTAWPVLAPSRGEMFSFVTDPGTIVFVPRGWWHSTQCVQDSVSATMTLMTRTHDEAGIDPGPGRFGRCVVGCLAHRR